MREYGIRKTEIYYVRANSSEEARALVDEMDNSYAWKVEVDVCYVSAEIEEWGACGACGEWSKGEHNCSEEVVLRKFIGNDKGDLFCATCERQGVWEDCPTHPDDHYTVICPKCGIEDKDCENFEVTYA